MPWLVRFSPPLIEGKLVRRYKRFFADVELPGGAVVTAHCANPGSMKTCLEPGAPAWLSRSDNPKRKLLHTWELARVNGEMVFVNPVRANDVVAEALARGRIPELSGAGEVRREVKYGKGSRVDFVLEGRRRRCFVEVKNVTLSLGSHRAAFPDSVTERGTRHLLELANVARGGDRAVLLFCVSRSRAASVEPADEVDPVYGETLRQVAKRGVEILAYRGRITTRGVTLGKRLPIAL